MDAFSSPVEKRKAIQVLTLNTLAFTINFACWMLNGVLVTFLVENRVFDWSNTQVGWLIGIPVLSGAVLRLPVGVLTDKYGGRIVYTIVMIVAAIPMFLLSFANSYWQFFFAGLGFGIAGTSFAVGIAYTSVWFPKNKQGTALGIFGAGNAGAAITSMLAPILLARLTLNGAQLEMWRTAPKIYSFVLLAMAIIFYFTTYSRKVDDSGKTTLLKRLQPLKYIRVWRYGLYYFLVFGGFVALAQWLIPYYVNAYMLSVATAGMMAAIFSLPSGVIRALGGWMSDRIGARKVMRLILASILVAAIFLFFPPMDVKTPGKGVMAQKSGIVTSITDDELIVDKTKYPIKPEVEVVSMADPITSTLVWPTSSSWQYPVVEVGEKVVRKQLLAQGVTYIHFQANVWIFTVLVFIVGIAMGIGKAAVYKYIPDYFPNDVGVVGGIVGVLGGLGGFICPILFGYLLESSGLWTTCWIFFALITGVCIWWMEHSIQAKEKKIAEEGKTSAIQVDVKNPSKVQEVTA
ncbi:MFS transporter [bacterium]|nr:MFS transporter [bacterium]